MSTQFATNILILSGQRLTTNGSNLYLNNVAISGGSGGAGTLTIGQDIVSSTAGSVLRVDSSTNLNQLKGTTNQVLGMNAAGGDLEFKSFTEGTNVTITHSAGGIEITAGGGAVAATGSVIGGVSGLVLSNRHYTVDFLGVAYQTGSVGANTIFRTINRTLGASVNVIMQHTGVTSGWNFAFPSGSSSGFTWVGNIQPIGIASGKMGVLSLTCLGTASNQIVGGYAEELV